MVDLTAVATEKIEDLLKEKGISSHGLRIFVSGGGCSGLQYGMAFEKQAQDGDQVFHKNGVTIYIDPISFPYVTGARIDYVDSLMGGGFNIENPNALSTCGCGQSFRAEGSTPAGYTGSCSSC